MRPGKMEALRKRNEKLVRLYREGLMVTRLATRFSLTLPGVYLVLRKAGVR